MSVYYKKIIPGISLLLFTAFTGKGQVPVYEEPVHQPVLVNQYIRLLDVWLAPGDTTLYHIHSTPSLFIYLSDTKIASQVKGEGWVQEKTVRGKTWYRSFTPDSLIHRVCNSDSFALHVNDIEILGFFDTENAQRIKPLPFNLLFENDRAFAYLLTEKSVNGINRQDRGPMVAVLVSGPSVIFDNPKAKTRSAISAGQFLYLEPGTAFHFSPAEEEAFRLVIFELK